MNAPKSFLWHDYETFGTDTAADRPAQFAALRTNAALEPTAEPVTWFCAPSDDMLPHPGACLVTGITPQQARREGVCEAEFAARIQGEMREPGTCIVGYNSRRFDDHVTRHLFYRNFFDPYAHEYSEGNSRFDLIDLLRMCYALRPDGINWPLHDTGAPSFRLEDLTAANDVEHRGAHDALADVRATLAMAQRVRQQQPRLFTWALSLRDRSAVARMLDASDPEPFIHTSSRIPAERGCTSLFLVLARHPRFGKSVIAYDLMEDPGPLIELDAAGIADRVFTPNVDLPDDVRRIPLKEIKTNGVPMVAPSTVLRGVDCDRIGLDPARCRAHATRIRQHLDELRPKVMDAFALPPGGGPTDPDLQLYDGFISNPDRALINRVHSVPPEALGRRDWPFSEARLRELMFRFRARNYPETLTAEEAERWDHWRRQRLQQPPDARILGCADFSVALAVEREKHREDGRALALLDQLESWAREIGCGDG